jgi:hypothetical protein
VAAAGPCIGPGTNFGGTNNGWNTAPCQTGPTSNRGGGGNAAGAAAGGAASIITGIGNIIEGAQGQECPALTRYNESAHSIDEQHHALWAKMFGDVSYRWQMNKQDCEKMREISQIEIPWRTKSAALQRAAIAQCSPITWAGRPGPEKFIADMKAANQKCLAVLRSGSTVATASPPNEQPQTSVSDACIAYDAPRASVRTPRDDGTWETNYIIHVRPTHKPGCPKTVGIKYTEPNGQVSPNNPCPYTIQTTGGPATDIHAIP